MTQELLRVFESIGVDTVFVGRRFSTSVSDVGNPSAKKVASVFSLAFRVVRAIFLSKPNVAVYFATNRLGSFLVDCVVLELIRWCRVPRVLYVHTVGFQSLADRCPFLRRAVHRMLGSANVIVCLSGVLAADVKPFATGQVVEIANFVVPPDRAADQETKHGEVRVSFLSNLIKEKGVDTFLRLAELSKGSGSSSVFRIAGAGSKPAVDAILNQISKPSHSNVSFFGALSAADKWRYLMDSDVFVFPSEYPFEAQPLVVLEALSVGVPVVAYDVGGVRDLIEHGVNGLIVSLGEIDSLSRVVQQLIQSPAEMSRLSGAAVFSAKTKHSEPVFREAWAELMDRFVRLRSN